MDMPRENWMGDMLTLAEWRAKLAAVPLRADARK